MSAFIRLSLRTNQGGGAPAGSALIPGSSGPNPQNVNRMQRVFQERFGGGVRTQSVGRRPKATHSSHRFAQPGAKGAPTHWSVTIQRLQAQLLAPQSETQCRCSPKGTLETSPTFQGWKFGLKLELSPKGTAEHPLHDPPRPRERFYPVGPGHESGGRRSRWESRSAQKNSPPGPRSKPDRRIANAIITLCAKTHCETKAAPHRKIETDAFTLLFGGL